MMDAHELGLSEGQIYRAGDIVSAGQYARIDRPGRVITLTQPDHLPASLDGTVAFYTPVTHAADLIGCRSQIRSRL